MAISNGQFFIYGGALSQS